MIGDRVLSINNALELARGLRSSKKQLGLTHGAFDLFHTGHLYLLEQSLSQCDYLFVGVESDENISQYKKADNRPVISAEERSRMVNILPNVITFIHDNPVARENYKELYKEFSPEFVSIGRKFAYDDIYIDAEESGSKVIEFVKDLQSTTKIINKIRTN